VYRTSALVDFGLAPISQSRDLRSDGQWRRATSRRVSSLFAPEVLLSVGSWMHGKAQADQWQRYIPDRMAHAYPVGQPGSSASSRL